MGRNKGVCAICGRGTKLTFEHVPPRAAGNDGDVTVYTIEEWLRRDLQSGEMPGGYIQPEGAGTFSICKSCNEYSGTWYVPEFAKFVRAGINIFRQLGRAAIEDADRGLEWKVVDFTIGGMRGLPVVKQVVASLLALNAPTFGRKNPELVTFVRDRESRGLPARYRLYVCLFAGPMARFAGLSVHASLLTNRIAYLTELAYPPFAFLLTLDSEPSQPTGEITSWSTCRFDEARDERLVLPVGFGHTAFPGDYRSRAKVDAERAANDALLREQISLRKADRRTAGTPDKSTEAD